MNEYLAHYNHNHDALGRFARSAGSASRTVGGKLTSNKKEKSNNLRKYESSQRLAKKKKASEAAVTTGKQKGSKSNNTKLSDSERKRIVDTGSVKEVIKNKDKLSTRELETAVHRLQNERMARINVEKKLSELDSPRNQRKRKTTIEKINSTADMLNKSANALDGGIRVWNDVAGIINVGLPDEEKLPMVSNKPQKKKNKPRKLKNAIYSF